MTPNLPPYIRVFYTPWTFLRPHSRNRTLSGNHKLLSRVAYDLQLLFSLLVLLVCGKYLERAWGYWEFAKVYSKSLPSFPMP